MYSLPVAAPRPQREVRGRAVSTRPQQELRGREDSPSALTGSELTSQVEARVGRSNYYFDGLSKASYSEYGYVS